MGDKEFKLEHEDFDYDDDEEEETLSLCDLAMNSNEPKWESDDYSKEDDHRRKRSSSSFDHEFFEFFSEDFTASSTTYPYSDGIIFCGKLITYKQPLILPEKTHISKTTTNTKKKSQPLIKREDQKINTKFDLTATPMKSSSLRWFLLGFGMTRFDPMEMELRDIKTRQSKKIPTAAMFRLDGGEEMVNGGGRRRRSTKGLWGLVRILGCRNVDATAIVKRNNFVT